MLRLFLLVTIIFCIGTASAKELVIELLPGADNANTPMQFDIRPDLVSDRDDTKGYCLTVRNGDEECYTFLGRFLGVGEVEMYYDGNHKHLYQMTEAPPEDRKVLQNAFLRVWAVDPSKAWYSDNTAN